MGERGWGASGFVDSKLEGHAASKLVPLVIRGNIGSVNSAFYIHLHIGGHIQELHSHQGLCIVYMELFAIVGKIHQVDVAIGREHDEVSKILSIFIFLWGCGKVKGRGC